MIDLYDMPGHLIRRAQRLAVAIFMNHMSTSGHDLTPVQFGALSVIGDNPGIDQATLAQHIAYDRVTIGGVIDRLCQKGHVQRLVNPEDRRSRVLSLTPGGATILQDAIPDVLAAQDGILAGLTTAERQTFMALLRKLVDQNEAKVSAG
jgi:DNA-binding MarR family transcriptional regulator